MAQFNPGEERNNKSLNLWQIKKLQIQFYREIKKWISRKIIMLVQNNYLHRIYHEALKSPCNWAFKNNTSNFILHKLCHKLHLENTLMLVLTKIRKQAPTKVPIVNIVACIYFLYGPLLMHKMYHYLVIYPILSV